MVPCALLEGQATIRLRVLALGIWRGPHASGAFTPERLPADGCAR